MLVGVEILAPGFEVAPYNGSTLRLEPVEFKDAAGASVPGYRAQLDVATRWRSESAARERLGVIALGCFDLVARWPAPATQVKITRIPDPGPSPVAIEDLTGYELGTILSGGAALPRMLAHLSPEAIERIEELTKLACMAPASSLDRLLGAMASASAAAAAVRPIDRLVPLWSALAQLRPTSGRELDLVDAVGMLSFADARLEADRTQAWKGLLRHRQRITRDGWFGRVLRARAGDGSRAIATRLMVATAVAYGARSAVAHGHWVRTSNERRELAKLAEEWLWTLVEGGVERQLCGRRLAKVDAISRSSVTV